MMRTLRALLSRNEPTPTLLPDRVEIAVLEHDLYGTPVAPNSMASAIIGLRALNNFEADSRETLTP